MNRTTIEQGFAKLIEVQRYIAATGVGINVRKMQVDLEKAMELVAAGCNDGEATELVKTEVQLEHENRWMRFFCIALEANIDGPAEVADACMKAFDKRFVAEKAPVTA